MTWEQGCPFKPSLTRNSSPQNQPVLLLFFTVCFALLALVPIQSFATTSPQFQTTVSPLRSKMPTPIQGSQRFSPFNDGYKTSTAPSQLRKQFESEKIEKQRTLYSNAIKALKIGDQTTFIANEAKLRDYPLYPYLRYFELSQSISTQPSETITQYITNNPHVPVTLFLKSRKLYSLAQTKQWAAYKKFYTPSQDRQLVCFYHQSQLETGDTKAAYKAIKALWLSGQAQAANCDPLFKRWMTSSDYKTDYAWRRFVRALELNNVTLAKFLIKHLPAQQQYFAEQGLQFYREPERLVCCNTNVHNSHMGDVRYIALLRLAGKDPQLALELWPALHQRYHYSGQRRTALLEHAATILAVRFDPAAEARLQEANPLRSHPLLTELEIRVALRNLDWKKAHLLIKSLPDHEFRTDRWQYWYARTLRNIAPKASYQSIYDQLAEKQNFYGILAREEFPEKKVQTLSYKISAADQAELIAQANIKRAYEFYVMGNEANARREWQYGMTILNDKQRYIAAEMANALNWSSLTIRAANSISSGKYVPLKYPMGFNNQITSHAIRNQVNPDLVFALIRQESMFTADAKSPVGALGVMQIMPATANLLNRKYRVGYKGPNELINPEKNIRLGTLYLRDLLNNFEGSEIKTIASYNAGPGSVNKWLTPSPLPLDVWVETIPYKETRNYVKQVLNNQDIYRRKLALKHRMLPDHISMNI